MKRFTDTRKFSDPWYRALPPRLKCLWEWMLAECNSAGVVDVDFPLASFVIGEAVNRDDLKHFSGRVELLPSGKLFLQKFVGFQYGKLSTGCQPHRRVIEEARGAGVLDRFDVVGTSPPLLPDRVGKGLLKGSNTLEDKEADTDQDKDQEEDKTVRGVVRGVEIPSLAEVLARAQFAGLAEWKARDWFDEMQGCGWLDYNGRKVVHWQSVLNRVRAKWEAEGRPAAPPAGNHAVNGARPMTPLDLRTIIAAKQARSAALKEAHCAEGPISNDWNNPKARAEFFGLKKEIKELNRKLSGMA